MGLDDLGLEVMGQRVGGDRTVLACKVVGVRIGGADAVGARAWLVTR